MCIFIVTPCSSGLYPWKYLVTYVESAFLQRPISFASVKLLGAITTKKCHFQISLTFWTHASGVNVNCKPMCFLWILKEDCLPPLPRFKDRTGRFSYTFPVLGIFSFSSSLFLWRLWPYRVLLPCSSSRLCLLSLHVAAEI